MKATIDQIKEAKGKAEKEISRIIGTFAKEYELRSLSVGIDIHVEHFYAELLYPPILHVSTEIKVTI